MIDFLRNVTTADSYSQGDSKSPFEYLPRLILLIFSLLITFENFAQNQTNLFEKANEYAAAEDYQQAVETYQQLLAGGAESAEVEYNLANIFFAQNKIGEAVLHYERALRLAPHDEDIQQNLRLAREKIESDITPVPTFFLADTWNGLQQTLPSFVWAIFFFIAFFGAVGGFILWQIGKERARRKQGFFAGLGLLLLSVLLFLLGNGKAKAEADSRAGIVLADKIVLHTAAEENSPPIRELREGMKVKIYDNINSWYKVKLENGEEGWLPQGVFEKI